MMKKVILGVAMVLSLGATAFGWMTAIRCNNLNVELTNELSNARIEIERLDDKIETIINTTDYELVEKYLIDNYGDYDYRIEIENGSNDEYVRFKAFINDKSFKSGYIDRAYHLNMLGE